MRERAGLMSFFVTLKLRDLMGRNPKTETRKPKTEGNPKAEIRNDTRLEQRLYSPG